MIAFLAKLAKGDITSRADWHSDQNAGARFAHGLIWAMVLVTPFWAGVFYLIAR